MELQQKLSFDAPPPQAPKRPGGKPRINKRRIFLAASGTFAVIAAAVALLTLSPKKKPVPLPRPPLAAEVKNEPPPLKVHEEVIKKGRTLSQMLSGYGFSGEEIERLKNRVRPVFNLNKIIADHTMKFTVDASGVVQSIEYPLDAENFLLMTREGADFKAVKKTYPFETRTAFIWGTIEDNPISAFSQRDENPSLAINMTDLFAWDIDFNTELRRGDSFRMVYEKKYLYDKFSGYGRILAAEFICQSKKYEVFRFEYPDTKKVDHFDRDGKSVRKEFLRSPLPFRARITSRFSFSRLHPIYKVYRPHYGVDYGAPIGTSVQATADGVVVSAGWNGEAGRMVHIRHKNSYETLYLHLSKVYVNAGERVTGGKIIGTVGSSGESTGPHLDYRVKQGGSYINPLSKKFLPVEPLRPQFKDAFKKEVEIFDYLLNAPLFIVRQSLLR